MNQTVCYQNKWILSEVVCAVSLVSSTITNTAKLENAILKRVGNYIIQDEKRINNKSYIRKIIHQQISLAKKRYRNEEATNLSALSHESTEGDKIEYDPADTCGPVDGKITLVETIRELSSDDKRRETILCAWSDGEYNEVKLSNVLVGIFGGTSEGHRKFINRFRKECQRKLKNIA